MTLTAYIKNIEKYNIKRSFDNRLQNLYIDYINFEDLLLTESQVNTFDINHLNEILENFHPALIRAPSVALIEDQYVLWEGQHSAGALWINGIDEIPCIVYECDDLSFKDIPTIEKFDKKQLVHLIDMFARETGCNTIEEIKDMLVEFDTSI